MNVAGQLLSSAWTIGTRRIGIAIGDAHIGHARPLCCIDNRQGTPDWITLDKLVEEWHPTALVVGWPLTDDGRKQSITGSRARL